MGGVCLGIRRLTCQEIAGGPSQYETILRRSSRNLLTHQSPVFSISGSPGKLHPSTHPCFLKLTNLHPLSANFRKKTYLDLHEMKRNRYLYVSRPTLIYTNLEPWLLWVASSDGDASPTVTQTFREKLVLMTSCYAIWDEKVATV